MKILFLKARNLCYQSNHLFIDEFKKALEKSNVDVEVLEVMDENSAEKLLPTIFHKHFDAVIDFNSVLSRAQDDEGTYFPDLLDAPFFNYIVDHPMFHQLYLEAPVKNMHAIAVDKNHVAYINKYIPSIKSAHFLPLGATKSNLEAKYEDKKIDILFSGTYMPSNEHLYFILNLPDKLKKANLNLIEYMESDRTKTLEQAVLDLDLQDKFIDEKFPTNPLHPFYRVDYYMRTKTRERLIDGLLKAGIKLDIVGSDWENYKTPYKNQIHFYKITSYRNSLQLMANSKITLNVQPLFKAGVHDRVLNSMMNKSVAVTDTSSYIEENFEAKKDLLLYNPEKIETLANDLTVLLENPSKQLEITTSAYDKIMKNHTWEARSKELIKIILSVLAPTS